MNPSAPSHQQWPCGPDCIFARPHDGVFDEWIWCVRPGADERLRRAGRECPGFQSTGGLPGNLGEPAGFSHRHQPAAE